MLRTSLSLITLSFSIILGACSDPEAEMKTEFISECERSFLEQDVASPAEAEPACTCVYGKLKAATTDEEFVIILDFFKNSSSETAELELRKALGKDRYLELGKNIDHCDPS